MTKSSLRVAICEDTAADEEKLLAILSDCSIPSACTVFHSGEEFLNIFRPGMFDLLLTDIYMGGMTGIETVTKIRESDSSLPVAFVTTSADFALESYRLSVLKYIEKPYAKESVEEILRLAMMQKLNAPALHYRKNGRDEKALISEIMYLEQQVHHLNIFLNDGTSVQIYERLSDFLPQLTEENFFVPHKSFAVNMNYVQYIDNDLKCFVMQNCKNIPIRRESMSKAKKALEQYFFSKARAGWHEK